MMLIHGVRLETESNHNSFRLHKLIFEISLIWDKPDPMLFATQSMISFAHFIYLGSFPASHTNDWLHWRFLYIRPPIFESILPAVFCPLGFKCGLKLSFELKMIPRYFSDNWEKTTCPPMQIWKIFCLRLFIKNTNSALCSANFRPKSST